MIKPLRYAALHVSKFLDVMFLLSIFESTDLHDVS